MGLGDAEADDAFTAAQTSDHGKQADVGIAQPNASRSDVTSEHGRPDSSSETSPGQEQPSTSGSDNVKAPGSGQTGGASAAPQIVSSVLEDEDLEGKSAPELCAIVRQLRREHAEQIEVETRTRSELEDMMIRIEKHFKAEKARAMLPQQRQAARLKAEELMQQAIESEVGLKQQLDRAESRYQELGAQLDADRAKLQGERDQLEGLRLDFEAEMQAAQAELASAQETLKSSEDRVRAEEHAVRQKLVADYEQRISSLTADMVRMRDEMQQRTTYMTREMQRYQAAAVGTSQAMLQAKKEMQERRKDIDAMRSRMDMVMERLYSGHEHNLTLQANIATAQDHAGQLFSDTAFNSLIGVLAPDLAGVPASSSAHGVKATARDGHARGGKLGQAAATAPLFPIHSQPSITELPPIQSQAPSKLYQTTQAVKAKQARVPAAKSKRAYNERFGGSKTRNEYHMAATMANW